MAEQRIGMAGPQPERKEGGCTRKKALNVGEGDFRYMITAFSKGHPLSKIYKKSWCSQEQGTGCRLTEEKDEGDTLSIKKEL